MLYEGLLKVMINSIGNKLAAVTFCAAIFSGLCFQHAAMAITPENVSTANSGGPELASEVSASVIALPTGAPQFIAASEGAPTGVQRAVGTGLASAYRSLLTSNNPDYAGLIVAAVCGASETGAAAFYASSIGSPLQVICGTPWADNSGPPPSLVRINATGGGGGSSHN